MNRFIDDVSVLAIEDCLIGKVSELFRSNQILAMNTDDIQNLAGEATESSVERKRLEEKCKILNAGLWGLQQLQKQRQFARQTQWNVMPLADEENKSNKTASSSEEASIGSPIMGSSSVMDVSEAPELQDTKDEEWSLPALPTQASKEKKKGKKKLSRELLDVFDV